MTAHPAPIAPQVRHHLEALASLPLQSHVDTGDPVTQRALCHALDTIAEQAARLTTSRKGHSR